MPPTNLYFDFSGELMTKENLVSNYPSPIKTNGLKNYPFKVGKSIDLSDLDNNYFPIKSSNKPSAKNLLAKTSMLNFINHATDFQIDNYEPNEFRFVNEVTKSNFSDLVEILPEAALEAIALESLEATPEGSLCFEAYTEYANLHIEVGDVTYFLVMSSTWKVVSSKMYSVKDGWSPVLETFRQFFSLL